MIDFYAWKGGNSYRVALVLEETGLDYQISPVDLQKGEHKAEPFQKLNPLGLVPVIIDECGPGGQRVTLTQTMAIMRYLAEKASALIPGSPLMEARMNEVTSTVITDLVGPINAGYALLRDTDQAEAFRYLTIRGKRVLPVLDEWLAAREYLAGAEISLADCAAFPMIHMLGDEALANLPHLDDWYQQMQARPSVDRVFNSLF